jgi:hypothetical protein
MNGEITLKSGRNIQITNIRQSLTYGGLVEGLPTAETNRRMIERVLLEKYTKSDKPLLIPPVEVPIEMDGQNYPFGKPAKLPYVLCVARLESIKAIKNPTFDFSALTVIWFQNEYAFPIEAEILTQIQDIDWDEYAFDFQI